MIDMLKNKNIKGIHDGETLPRRIRRVFDEFDNPRMYRRHRFSVKI